MEIPSFSPLDLAFCGNEFVVAEVLRQIHCRLLKLMIEYYCRIVDHCVPKNETQVLAQADVSYLLVRMMQSKPSHRVMRQLSSALQEAPAPCVESMKPEEMQELWIHLGQDSDFLLLE